MGALIITADLRPDELAWLDGLRRTHYPPERNQVAAHLTLFAALPPSAEEEARRLLSRCARNPPPRAMLSGLIDLGGGVAFRVASQELDRMRDQLAEHFHGLLGAQDGPGWRPHITIQNKVSAGEARRLKEKLEQGFVPRPLHIRGLSLHRYLGGPWEEIGSYPFRGR